MVDNAHTATPNGWNQLIGGSNRVKAAVAIVLVISAIWFSATCMRSQGALSHQVPALPTVKIRLDHSVFTLWVAATEAQKEKGLMNVTSLAANRGMIFLFQPPQTARFWMKNTLIPLDILFILKSGKITNCLTMPVDNGKKIYISRGPISFAIELKVGTIRRCGLRVGQFVKLPIQRLKQISSTANQEVSHP